MNSLRPMKGFALVLAAAAGAANAQVVNGSFEQNGKYSTTITGWSTYGNNAVFTADTQFFDTPTDGTYQAHLSSNTDGSDGEPDGNGLPLIYSAAGVNAAEAFLGVAPGALTAASNTLAVDGSGRAIASNLFRIAAMKQTVHLKAGDTVFFDYQMLTSELYKSGDGSQSDFNYRPTTNANDFSFLTLSGGGNQTVLKLLDTFYGFVEHNPSSPTGFETGYTETPFDNNTGVGDIYFMQTPYLTYSFAVPTEGDYVIGFGVTDAFTGIQGNSGIPSGLSIDNIRVQSVPEPASMAALGLGAVAILRRRKRA